MRKESSIPLAEWFSTLTIILLLAQLSLGNLVGYDCMHPNTTIKTISLHQVSQCSFIKEVTSSQVVYVQVVSPKSYSTLAVKRCEVTRSSLLTYCGTSSHASIMPDALAIDELVPMSIADCELMHSSLSYTTPTGVRIEGLKPNTRTIKRLTDIGVLELDGTCTGTTFVVNGITYKNTIRSSEYKIKIWDESATLNIVSKTITFRDGSTCTYRTGGCLVPLQGTAAWPVSDEYHLCGSDQYNLIFEGYANITESDLSPKALVVETPDQHFALAIDKHRPICNHEGYTTETSDLMVILGAPGTLPKHTRADNPKDLNTFMDLNLKFIYIERNIANRTTDLYNVFAKRYCEIGRQQLVHLLSLARTNPEEFAWVYTSKEGYTAVTRGEVVQLIKCVPVVVIPRPSLSCYNELPVWYKNESYFLKPSSRNLIRYGTELPCDGPIQTMFMINHEWVKIGGGLQLTDAPIQLSPDFKDTWSYGPIKSLGQIGYLTKEQINTVRDAMIGPMEKQIITDTITYKVSRAGHVSNQGLNFNTIIDQDTLSLSLTDKVLNRIYGVWDFMVKNLGAVLGFFLVWDLFWGLMSFLLNTWMLFRKFGFSGLLIMAFWSSITKHVLYGDLSTNRFFKARKQKRGVNIETDPELGIPLSEDLESKPTSMGNNVASGDKRETSMYPKINPLF